ncbi:MAG: Exodeoxyribonuclease III [Synergistetes bacterium ADurb.BinA166]|jgi:exodeoxyribonuclease-3|nr:MAG: Exodeoxyribonuclease III [Synergistetes bacterium ADurb.BinA166]
MPRVSIATFNVNSVRTRLPALQRWLSGQPVDVLCLQETKVTDDGFPKDAFEQMGYRAVFRGEKSYNGVALLTRATMEGFAIGFGDGEEPECDTRVIRGRIGDFFFINTYVPQGKAIDHADYVFKHRFLDRMLALIDREYDTTEKIAWVGDMNVAPTDIDVTSPEKKRDHPCFAPDIQQKFEHVKSWGFVDLFRKFRPGEGEFSFFDYRVKNALERNIGWRIDHVLTTPALAERAVDCYIDRAPRGWEQPSDHAPVVAVFDL